MEKDIFLYDDERLDYVNEKITLIQKKQGLTFGTDAFLLASYVKSAPRARAVELGAGTGIVSLLLAARDKLSLIYAAEVQDSFFDITKRNIENNGFGEKVIPLLADIRDIRPADVGGELDVVFSNPPYMKTNSGKRNDADEKYIARHEVMGDIGDFCGAAARLLKFGGRFYVVYRPDRMCELISAMRAHSLEPKAMTFVHADVDSEPSMVLVCATKGGKPDLKISAPLILHDKAHGKGTRELSARAAKIYETLDFGL